MAELEITKRGLIRFAGGAMALAAAGSPVSAVAAGPSPLEDLMAATFPDNRSAKAVGRQYLADYCTPGGGGETVDAIAPLLLSRLQASGREAGDLRAALAAEIRKDYRNRDIVTVDGWVLSRSEARLCALAAIYG